MSVKKNATTLPQVYYGLHMVPGVAEYDEGESPYRIFIGENAIKNMDSSFQGKPVYVHHVDEVNLEKIQEQADGYVIESFYNKADGKHWAKFIVVSDAGREAIRNGWKLSNAYIPKHFAGGGLWNGVEYLKEVTGGEYEHLAIVPNPRYGESVILTPEQFKNYNEEKEIELKKVANSNNKGAFTMLNFFKKSKVENTADFESMSVVLPKSKKEVTLATLVNEMDEHYKKDEGKDPKAPAMANGEHHVEVGGEKMSVNDLVSKHLSMKQEMEDMKKAKEENDDGDMGDDASMDNEDLDGGEMEAQKDKKAADKTENEDLDGGEKEAQKDKKAADKTENKKKNELEAKRAEAKKRAEALKNAPFTVIHDPIKVDLDKAARGKARYGSSN